MSTRSPRSVFAVGVVSFGPLLSLLLLLGACNAERKEECEKFLAALKPVDSLDPKTPSADVVDRLESAVGSIQFQDQPLGVFAKNFRATLTVLSTTIKLQASPSPPDGTDDVVKVKVKEARTQRDDAVRYCAQ
jgi:hypothetical protein